jgi:DNA-binding GntR family transcriptional regulator
VGFDMSADPKPSPMPAPRASDLAYERIRDAIVELRFWPGTTLDEKTIAQAIGLGRTPVREAVLRLAAEGLVVVLSRRGLLIPPIGLGEVREIFEARRPIECAIARLAALLASPEELAHLAQLVEETEAPDVRRDLGRYVSLDQVVHHELARLSRNRFLITAADRILRHNERLWRYYFSARPGDVGALVSHEELLAALLARDPEAAERAMARHVESARAYLHALF